MTKKCKVVMLPQTIKRLPALFKLSNGMIFVWTNSNIKTMGEYYDLYFTSDEDIKVGDILMHNVTRLIFKVLASDPIDIVEQAYKTNRKVVASTDPSLGLPAIPQSFVERFIEQNGKIDEVELETESRASKTTPIQYNTNWVEYILKLTKNNEVIVVDDEQVQLNKFVSNIISAAPTKEYTIEELKEFIAKPDTLEEAATNYQNKVWNTQKAENDYEAFRAGAQWMKEQSPWTDGDVVEIYIKLIEERGDWRIAEDITNILNAIAIYKQSKNK